MVLTRWTHASATPSHSHGPTIPPSVDMWARVVSRSPAPAYSLSLRLWGPLPRSAHPCACVPSPVPLPYGLHASIRTYVADVWDRTVRSVPIPNRPQQIRHVHWDSLGRVSEPKPQCRLALGHIMPISTKSSPPAWPSNAVMLPPTRAPSRSRGEKDSHHRRYSPWVTLRPWQVK